MLNKIEEEKLKKQEFEIKIHRFFDIDLNSKVEDGYTELRYRMAINEEHNKLLEYYKKCLFGSYSTYLSKEHLYEVIKTIENKSLFVNDHYTTLKQLKEEYKFSKSTKMVSAE